jgi:hypothetical protein
MLITVHHAGQPAAPSASPSLPDAAEGIAARAYRAAAVRPSGSPMPIFVGGGVQADVCWTNANATGRTVKPTTRLLCPRST